MATDPPPQSWLSRNTHIIVWVAVLLIAALGLSWTYLMPQQQAPQVTQVSAPARPSATLSRDQTTTQRAADEKAAADKAADDRAWADATRAGTAAAVEAYIQNNPSGAHVADARARATTLAEQVRREAEARLAAERAAA